MNVFQYQKETKILAFTTQAGHVSGTLMKNIDFRSPAHILKLKEWCSESPRQNGDIFETSLYVFVVLRKHYNNKLSEKMFDTALSKNLNKLKSKNLKTTFEDFSDYKEQVFKHLPNLKIYEKSGWKK